MTINQFKFNITRLFQERGINYVEFNPHTYESEVYCPYDPRNEARILIIYIEDGEICYSTESDDGMLTQNKISDLNDYKEMSLFLDGLFYDTYDYISSEETDGTCEEFIEESKSDQSFLNVMYKAGVPGDYSVDDDNVVIYIEDGDWKHEHRYADWLMECMGFKFLYQEDEPSDCDCYTATHYYLIP